MVAILKGRKFSNDIVLPSDLMLVCKGSFAGAILLSNAILIKIILSFQIAIANSSVKYALFSPQCKHHLNDSFKEKKKFCKFGYRDLYYKTFYGSNCCHIVIS